MAEGSSSNAAVWLISVPLARIPRGCYQALSKCLNILVILPWF